MKIALVGDRKSGKTAFFAGLHAQFRRRHAAHLITNPTVIGELANLGIAEQANFWIKGYAHDNDLRTLNGLADELTSRPLRWPGRTEFGDFFPIDFVFERFSLSDKSWNSREKRLVLMDFPGSHFSSDHDDVAEALETRQRAGDSQAIVVFLDSSNTTTLESSFNGVFESIFGILRASASSVSGSRDLLPVSVVLSKFDSHPIDQWNDLHKEIFNDIVTQISAVDGRILVLSTPISVTNDRRTRFLPTNLHYPFLFSAMGIIMSQHYGLLTDAERARYTRRQGGLFEGLLRRGWQFVNDPRTVGSMERNAQADLELAQAIVSSFRADIYLNRGSLRFAQSGIELESSQLGHVL